MTRLSATPRWARAAAVTVTTAALGAAALTASNSATADRAARPVPPPPTTPARADQIQNIDQVKTAIKGYYGDTVDPDRTNPIDGTALHTFSPTGNYAHEVGGIVRGAKQYLGKHRHAPARAKKAILFDVDDTTLNTYSYEIYSNFVYNPTTNAAFVNGNVFRAVPHVVDLEKYAEARGYTVFFLTGRPEAQRSGTIQNLTSEGYDVSSANLYLKDLTKPIYGSCYQPSANRTCTTIQYKSLTRKYIESQGYDIVANFGDQYSDLSGGYANRTYKLPNPMYYLP
ncbi:HAD superfamily, subfamily IIIB (Acid phosphatase) [Jatrophihabitans endophyticus]|uniref:HAD superfamily, subfamily IIIB (Acid phosphatase) n=1 Tax=Jatrophihabitans endophyticus TaxID=1206085 RepID=A0A1M5M7F0_9ACTN|nr:HAD family acid phosphatase [Jatrophihabitans endophyticus]SHG73197.1 HAD superfamily, subfamily IIIB (Acid phosphatase) [Jatrophihabitans endophyticus]